MKLTIVVASDGLTPETEVFWAQLEAAMSRATSPVQLIVATGSDRLKRRIASKFFCPMVFVEPAECKGSTWNRCAQRALADIVIFWDDHVHASDAESLAKAMDAMCNFGPYCVPTIAGSYNADQAGVGGCITTRPIDRGVLMMPRCYIGPHQFGQGYARDGFQVEMQASLAKQGFGALVANNVPLERSVPDEPGGDVPGDMHRLATALGTHTEHRGTRLALPRILPVQQGIFDLPPSREIAEDVINTSGHSFYNFGGATHKRIAIGDRFSILPLLTRYSLYLSRWMGLGDALMFTAAFRELKLRRPDIRLSVWTYGYAKEVFHRCPEVDDLYDLGDRKRPPIDACDWTIGNAIEGTAQIGFWALGMEDAKDRKMSFVPKPCATCHTDRPRIGIGLHGNWMHKRYEHWQQVVDALIEKGYDVLAFGQGACETPKGAIDLQHRCLSLDHMAGYLTDLKGFIGFDSGPTYMANALGIPTVWLFASHDPRGLIDGCGAAAPYEVIKGWGPTRCLEQHGRSCRHNSGGPSVCPLRNASGADCLDEIDPQRVVLALESVTERATCFPSVSSQGR